MKKLISAILGGGLLAALAWLRPAGPPGASHPRSAAVAVVPATAGATATGVGPALAPFPPSAQLVNEIARTLRTGDSVARERVFNQLLPELIATNAAAAARLAEEWEPGPLRVELLRQVTRQWTAVDFAGAMTWLADLAGRRDRQYAAEAGVAEIARTDPAGAIEVAQVFQVGTGDGSIEHLAQLWTEESPHEAVDWILGRPVGPQRDQLLARIAFVRAQSDPAEAATLTVDFMSPGAARDEAIAAVSRQWAVRDPAAATAWVERFPSGPLRARGLAEVAAGQRLR